MKQDTYAHVGAIGTMRVGMEVLCVSPSGIDGQVAKILERQLWEKPRYIPRLSRLETVVCLGEGGAIAREHIRI